MKVLLVFKSPQVDNPDACHAGMGVTACNTVMALREARIDADFKPVTNGEYLWSRLASDWAAYTCVMLCAPFIDAAFLEKLAAAFPKVRFVVIYHSNLGFLSVDQFAMRSIPQFLDLQERTKNFAVGANSIELANSITAVSGIEMAWLPNIFHLPHVVRRTKPAWKRPLPLHVGLFGASRVLKNWLTAAASVGILQRHVQVPVTLHVNSGREEGGAGSRGGIDALLKLNTGVQLVEVPWLSVDDFRRYLYGMDLLLQPSFTETFNNVTADGVYSGVPSVVSDAITWAPETWKARADSACDLARVSLALLRDSKAAARGQKALDAHNETALAAWQRYLA